MSRSVGWYGIQRDYQMEVTHETCPFCSHNDCFSYNTTTGLFNCFSCGATNGSQRCYIYDGKTQVPFGETKVEAVVYNSEPYTRDYRGISGTTLEAHGGYFTKDGQGNETVHWVYPNGTKHRQLPKSIKNSGKMDHFFGADEYSGGNNITITEGEEDRLSVIEMMGDYPTVSVPNATPSKVFWENAREYLHNFEKIILSIDNDDAGNALVEKFSRIFPGKVYRVHHGEYKDANDYLLNKAQKEYRTAWWNAKRIKPESILSTADDFIKLFDETPNYDYFPTGITGLDEKMMGIHKGALTVVLAETGIGKTEFFRYLQFQALNNSDYNIAFCHGEEAQLRSILGLFSYWEGKNLTKKEMVEELGYEERYKEFAKWLTDDERVYQFKIRVDEGVPEIVDQVRFLAIAMGVDYIFLEPIQDFVTGANTSEKESLLTDLTNQLKRLASELNVGIVIIAHSNKEGEAKYCASIVQGAAYEIKLHRDVDNKNPHEANTTRVYVGRKNRTGGGSGYAGALYFDLDSFMLEPIDADDIEEF